MERAEIADLPSRSSPGKGERRGLSEPLDTEEVAINHYRLRPGDGFAGGLHAHMDQEEIFLILEGVATFETLHGRLTAKEGEAIRFSPGEFQRGWNDGDSDLVALAIGAPPESTDIRLPLSCEACTQDNVRLDMDGESILFVCPACGAARQPAECVECGAGELEVQLDSSREPVVICQTCGKTYERPPAVDR